MEWECLRHFWHTMNPKCDIRSFDICDSELLKNVSAKRFTTTFALSYLSELTVSKVGEHLPHKRHNSTVPVTPSGDQHANLRDMWSESTPFQAWEPDRMHTCSKWHHEGFLSAISTKKSQSRRITNFLGMEATYSKPPISRLVVYRTYPSYPPQFVINPHFCWTKYQ